MSFRFRLATMLKLREQARDERRRDLAQAIEAERILNTQLAEIQAEVQETQNRFRESAAKREVSVDDLMNGRRYEAMLKMQIVGVRKQIHDVQIEMQKRREALLEADREVKVLEKLRERGEEQYAAGKQHRDNKELDEAAVRGFARREATT